MAERSPGARVPMGQAACNCGSFPPLKRRARPPPRDRTGAACNCGSFPPLKRGARGDFERFTRHSGATRRASPPRAEHSSSSLPQLPGRRAAVPSVADTSARGPGPNLSGDPKGRRPLSSRQVGHGPKAMAPPCAGATGIFLIETRLANAQVRGHRDEHAFRCDVRGASGCTVYARTRACISPRSIERSPPC